MSKRQIEFNSDNLVCDKLIERLSLLIHENDRDEIALDLSSIKTFLKTFLKNEFSMLKMNSYEDWIRFLKDKKFRISRKEHALSRSEESFEAGKSLLSSNSKILATLNCFDSCLNQLNKPDREKTMSLEQAISTQAERIQAFEKQLNEFCDDDKFLEHEASAMKKDNLCLSNEVKKTEALCLQNAPIDLLQLKELESMSDLQKAIQGWEIYRAHSSLITVSYLNNLYLDIKLAWVNEELMAEAFEFLPTENCETSTLQYRASQMLLSRPCDDLPLLLHTILSYLDSFSKYDREIEAMVGCEVEILNEIPESVDLNSIRINSSCCSSLESFLLLERKFIPVLLCFFFPLSHFKFEIVLLFHYNFIQYGSFVKYYGTFKENEFMKQIQEYLSKSQSLSSFVSFIHALVEKASK